MLPSYGAWLARPLLTLFGYGALLSLACGGMAIDGEDDPGDNMLGGGGVAGRVGNAGGSGGGNATGGSNGGNGGDGARGGNGGAGGSFSPGGAGGVGNAGDAGFAGAVSFAGSAASFAGSAGAAGSAGSATMEGPSVCVDLSAGLAGLPSQAFPADDDLARDICGTSDFTAGLVYQAICLPAPGNGQSCSSFYPENLLSLLYECGAQSTASFLCGPDRPPPGTPGCVGNECCYVLAGGCPGAR